MCETRHRRYGAHALAGVVCTLLVFVLPACMRERATPELCRTIVDRIVEIELLELGYRDPKLLRAKQSEIEQRFAAMLEQCPGRPIPPQAEACIATARTTEALTHECLRLGGWARH